MTYGSYRITCIDIVPVGDYDKRYFHLNKVACQYLMEIYLISFFCKDQRC